MKWYRVCNRISLLLHALFSAAGYFLIETICRHSFTETWTFMRERPLVFAYNAGFIFVTSLIVYLFRKRCFMRLVVVYFWLLLAAVNGIILSARVTPFTGPDLHLLSDAFGLVNKYLPPVGVVLACILFALLILFLLVVLIKSPKYKGTLKYRYNIPLILAAIVAFGGVTQLALEKRVLSNYFGNIAFAYEDYGYPYCLATTIFNTGISCPRDYSDGEIRRIQHTEDNLPETREGDYPNIIFLQLESFFDPELVNYLKISEDPIPTFRQLMKDYSSGYFKVPAVGAGTANTEFETITGMSLHYFGPGEYPYKSILKETACESAAYVLKNLGFATHAVHNHEANFYGRKTVFPNLGFDTFTSEEYMPKENQINPQGWVKDSILTEEIFKCLNATEEKDYIYTISVQGHGAYPEEPILEDPLITVTGSATQEKNYQWEYYVNQIREMDDFIKDLVTQLSDYDEDVILVMYGDHLPTMDLTVEDLENRYLFQTQYVIWDNFGMKKSDVNLSSYQIAAEVLDRIGIHEGSIFRYHQARKNTKNYQVDLETLQYDILYGERYVYGGEMPFQRSKMRLGLYDVTLDSMELISVADFTYYIRGTNFTPSSQVQLNGEWYDTVYVSPATLMISGKELDPFDRILVAQRSNSSTRKALSKSYERACYAVLVNSEWKLPEIPEENVG